MLSGELGYSYKLNRIGIGAQGGVQRQNYLAPDESDRDLTTWRGSVRVSAQLAAGRDVFLLGFVSRRDHRLSVDRSGLDRDATTLGFLTGAGLDRKNAAGGRGVDEGGEMGGRRHMQK